MTEPTLVPKQLSTPENIAKLTWTKIPGTEDLFSYALFECDEVYSAWKTWADASNDADKKAWDGSKYILALNWEPLQSSSIVWNDGNNEDNNGLCFYKTAGGDKNNPGYCLWVNDNGDWATFKFGQTSSCSDVAW